MKSEIIKAANILPNGVKKVRVDMMLYCITIIYLALVAKILNISSNAHTDSVLSFSEEDNIKVRANIVDCNGNIIATDVETASLYVHPAEVKNKEEAAKLLHAVLGDVSEEYIVSSLSSEKNFVWLKRHVNLKDRENINNLGIPGIYFHKDIKRLYTTENDFSHIVGYTNIDGFPMSGVERSFEAELTKRPSEDFALSMDMRIQHLMRRALQQAVITHEAKSGAGIMMNVNTGEIIGSVSYPDFNPHNIKGGADATMFNSAIMSFLEVGSLMKILTVAMALNEGVVNVNDVFDIGKAVLIGKFRVKDYRGRVGKLSLPEILMYSSNIGVVQVARLLGKEKHIKYIENLEFLSNVKHELSESARSVRAANFSEARLATFSYGYGLAIAPLDLLRGISAAVNGGYLPQVTFRKRDQASQQVAMEQRRRVFSQETSDIMRKLLRLVVKSGSARRANVAEYLNGGKTGTAEKINASGGYNHDANISSFVGVFPMNAPEYILYISLDEPKRNEANRGFITGGAIAAPVARSIIRQSGRILNMKIGDLEQANESLYLDYPHQRK